MACSIQYYVFLNFVEFFFWELKFEILKTVYGPPSLFLSGFFMGVNQDKICGDIV